MHIYEEGVSGSAKGEGRLALLYGLQKLGWGVGGAKHSDAGLRSSDTDRKTKRRPIFLAVRDPIWGPGPAPMLTDDAPFASIRSAVGHLDPGAEGTEVGNGGILSPFL